MDRHDFRAVLGALVVAVGLPAGAQTLAVTVRGIHPPAPRPFEMVNLRLTTDACIGQPWEIPVAQVDGEIRVTILPVVPALCGVPPPNTLENFEVRLGAFPVGTYAVNVVSGGTTPLVLPQRLTFEVVAPFEISMFPPVPKPLTDFTGVWWSSPQSGWGVTITQSVTNQLFVGFYVYDESGRPQWYVAPGGTWMDPWRWSGTLYRTSGPPFSAFLGGTFDPEAVLRTPVGTAEFGFKPSSAFSDTDFGRGWFTYSIDGVRGTRAIRRLEY